MPTTTTTTTLLTAIALHAAALAAEPVVRRSEDSWIDAHVDIAAAPEAVFALVSSPEGVARIEGTTDVQVTADGSCLRVQTRVNHPIASVSYQSRACPDGKWAVRQVLVSGDMKAFESRWWVEAQEGGARLHYRVRTVPDLPIPQAIVDRSSASAVTLMMQKLRDHLEP